MKCKTNKLSKPRFGPLIEPLSGATIPGQDGPGSDDNKGVLHIPQNSSISGASPSDCFVSYTGHSLGSWGSYPSADVQSVYYISDCFVSYTGHLMGESYSFAEMQLVYSTPPADWAVYNSVFNEESFSCSFYVTMEWCCSE